MTAHTIAINVGALVAVAVAVYIVIRKRTKK
jgi:hypothetical protein